MTSIVREKAQTQIKYKYGLTSLNRLYYGSTKRFGDNQG